MISSEVWLAPENWFVTFEPSEAKATCYTRPTAAQVRGMYTSPLDLTLPTLGPCIYCSSEHNDEDPEKWKKSSILKSTIYKPGGV